MKLKKVHKGKTNTAVKVPVPMNQSLLTGIRDLILSARRQVAQAVNAGFTMLYWEIGRRIRQDILEEKRAAYGKEIVAAVRRQLGWTHFKSLIPIEDLLKREFHAEMCRIQGTRLTLEEVVRSWSQEEKHAEWQRYLKELREKHFRKRRLMEILDGLDGKPIVKKRR